MLTELCAEIRNYFLRGDDDIHAGSYEIKDGSLVLPFLLNKQYFRIVGSALNDGVYQYPAEGLIDESFAGAVWAMAVPPQVIALSREIDEWNEKNADAINSPYTSESFGNYSYSKSAGSQGGGVLAWQDQFRAKLNPYRRLNVL